MAYRLENFDDALLFGLHVDAFKDFRVLASTEFAHNLVVILDAAEESMRMDGLCVPPVNDEIVIVPVLARHGVVGIRVFARNAAYLLTGHQW